MAQVLGTDPGEGISGTGATLEGDTFGAMGMITKIGVAGLDADPIDITTLNTEDGWKAFIAGLKDAKELNLDLLYETTNCGSLITALAVSDTWTIAFPDGATLECVGFISHIGADIPNGDKISQSVTIKLSGKPTYTPGS